MDEFGKLLYQVCRHDPKDFSQRRPDGFGGWVNNAGARRVLYHLPEVLESPILFIVEGERDCETLREHGFVATTNSCGAGDSAKKWRTEYTAALAGRECILIPDNDAPGRERVITIAKALIGHAAKIVILELEGCKDVTDWFANGHSEVELIQLVASEGVHSEA